MTTGERCLHFRLTEVVDRSLTGTLSRAHDEQTGQKTLIHRLDGILLTDGAISSESLLGSSKSLLGLRHANIASVTEVGEDGGIPFLVLRDPPGSTLPDWDSPGRAASAAERVSVMLGVAKGLLHAHQQGILHRDFRPGSVKVTASGAAKIRGFVPVRVKLSLQSLLKNEEFVPGSLDYLSPEHLTGLDLDFRSDIFSFGVVLYELLTGRHPFRTANDTGTANRILSTDAEPIGAVCDDLPDDFARVIDKAVQKEPEDRQQSFKEMVSALADALPELRQRRSAAPVLRSEIRTSAPEAPVAPVTPTPAPERATPASVTPAVPKPNPTPAPATPVSAAPTVSNPPPAPAAAASVTPAVPGPTPAPATPASTTPAASPPAPMPPAAVEPTPAAAAPRATAAPAPAQEPAPPENDPAPSAKTISSDLSRIKAALAAPPPKPPVAGMKTGRRLTAGLPPNLKTKGPERQSRPAEMVQPVKKPEPAGTTSAKPAPPVVKQPDTKPAAVAPVKAKRTEPAKPVEAPSIQLGMDTPRERRFLLPAAALLATVLAGGGFWYFGMRTDSAEPLAPPPPPPVAASPAPDQPEESAGTEAASIPAAPVTSEASPPPANPDPAPTPNTVALIEKQAPIASAESSRPAPRPSTRPWQDPVPLKPADTPATSVIASEPPPIRTAGSAPTGIVGNLAGQSPALPPPPPVKARTRIGGRAQPAKLVHQRPPAYPPAARAARVAGTVRLRAHVNTSGEVESVTYMDGPKILSQAAINAVKQWRYEPAILNGNPVPVDTVVQVKFTLNR